MTSRSSVRTLVGAIRRGQVFLATVSFHAHRLARKDRHAEGFVVGLQEIAGVLAGMGDALEDAVTVNCGQHPFYDRRYDFVRAPRGSGRASRLLYTARWLVGGPILLGRLAAARRTFVYVGAAGFLASQFDGREHEFRFLRDHGRHVVCYFTGTEIRSHVLLDRFGAKLDRDVVTTFQRFVSPGIFTSAADEQRRRLAEAADRHADLVFNASVDQMSYLESPVQPCLYFCPDELIRSRPEKWSNLERLRVVHAPSSPIIKGTPIVHAAVKALRESGYEFEYIELVGRPHTEVLACLETAHIVLNEFYALVPGVFGVEAMASNAVVLTAADPALEPTLAPGADEAWVVTPYWRVQDNLRHALDHPGELQAQADRGTEWVRAHCSRSSDTQRMMSMLGGG